MKYLLGPSTGCLYKLGISLTDKVKFIKSLGANAIELGFGHKDRLAPDQLSGLTSELLRNFDYVSVHAPSDHEYENNTETREILDKLSNINKNIRELNLVVIHPDKIKDYSVFRNYDLLFAIENSDTRKPFGQKPEELIPILKANPNFQITLDLNHVYGNDRSMSLAKDFYKKLGNKIAEIHLSGYVTHHDPLFKTKQIEILNALKNLENPLIIESPVNSTKELKKEYLYVKNNLSHVNTS
jgi:hypothetical protein